MRIESPTPQQILEARKAAKLTQTAAAALIYTALGSWQKWELGTRKMHPAMWELFLLKIRSSL